MRQGHEGDIVTFDPAYEPMDEVERIQGPAWVIDEALGPCFGRTSCP